MTTDELLSAGPIHNQDGGARFIVVSEIPEPWRAQFLDALRGSQCPRVPGYGECAYAWDWEQWVAGGSWYGPPQGLVPCPTRRDAGPGPNS